VQTNKYRKVREMKRLQEQGLSYLLQYIENYIFLKMLKMSATFRTLVYGIIRHSEIVRSLFQAALRNNSKYADISKYDLDHYSKVRALKKLIRESGQDTEVIMTSNINSAETVSKLKALNCDILIILGGQIISEDVLNTAKITTLTVHNTVLPHLRGYGGGEIWALVKQNKKALGSTIFYTDLGMDVGDILLQEELKIEKNDTLEDLCSRNVILGKNLLITSLKLLEEGNAPRKPQNHNNVSYINGPPTNDEIHQAQKTLHEWSDNT